MFNVNGIADFKNVSEEDKEYIEEKLSLVNKRYGNDVAIGLAYESIASIGLARHIFDFAIILKTGSSDYINDVAAKAIALSREGVYYRRQAIQAFERFFEIETENFVEDKTVNVENSIAVTLFSDWFLHSELSMLYEREYEFDKAIDQLRLCIKYSEGRNPADFTRIGDILIKSDMQEAEKYYNKLFESKYYKMHEYAFDCAYGRLKEKIASGYIYRPRKNKKAPILSDAQLIATSAAKCLM